jgi:hypothetical protein
VTGEPPTARAGATGPVHRSEELHAVSVALAPVPQLEQASAARWQTPLAGTFSGRLEHTPAPTPPARVTDPGAADSPAWSRAADAGVSIGRASTTAGVATAGFFRRFGKKVAGAF